MNKPILKTVYVPTEFALNEGFGTEDFNEIKVITFTPEEYNQHIQEVIKDALNTAAGKADTMNDWSGNTGSEYCDTIVNEKSITNTFEETFNKYKYE